MYFAPGLDFPGGSDTQVTKVLVTGGAGFIGSHTCDICREAGDDITAVDNFATGLRENLAAGHTLIEGDLADPAFAHSLVEQIHPEVIYHLAAQSSVIRSLEDPALDLRTNAGATLALLEAARKQKNPPVFVYASTGGAGYGDPETIPVAEDHPAEYRSPYAASKHAGEEYVALYARLHGMRTISLRLGNIYGPRQRSDLEAGAVSIFAEKIHRKEPITLFGNGKAARDYVYVADAVTALRTGAQHAGGGEVFNIGTGAATDVAELLRLLAAALDRPPIRAAHAPLRPGEVFRISLDSSRFRAATGWAPRYSLEEGLAAFAEWFQSARA